MIVFKFGVRRIVSGANAARAEMRTAHHLFNALVSVERWKRAAFATIRSRYVPGLSEVEAAYQQIDDWMGEHAGPAGERGKIREKRRLATAKDRMPTKRVDDAEEVDTIAELKTWRRAASELAKPLRASFAALVDPADTEYARRTAGATGPHHKKRLNQEARTAMLSEPWHDAWKEIARLESVAYELRAWIGDAHMLNHGTYAAVGDDVVRAGKRPKPRPDGEPRRPKQRPAFSSRGLRKMGWQIQGGIAWSDVLAGKCRDFRVENMRPVGGNGHRWRAEVSIRISTAERGVSEWVTADTAIHRPVPGDTKILWIYLVPEVHRDGRMDYSVQFTAQPTTTLIERAPGSGHAHVEFCWSRDGETLRVARVNGEPVWLPVIIPSRIAHAESLRSAAGKLFDEAQRVAHEHGVGYHRSPDRLAQTILTRDKEREDWLAVWETYRSERLAAQLDLMATREETAAWAAAHGVDPVAFWLTCWRRKDKHLRQMEQGNRDHATRGRTDFYRVTAARLSTEFATVSFGGAVNVAALALRDKAEDRPARELHEAARRNRVVATVGELRAAIEYAFGRERLRDAPDPGGARVSMNPAGSDASAASTAAAE